MAAVQAPAIAAVSGAAQTAAPPSPLRFPQQAS